MKFDVFTADFMHKGSNTSSVTQLRIASYSDGRNTYRRKQRIFVTSCATPVCWIHITTREKGVMRC